MLRPATGQQPAQWWRVGALKLEARPQPSSTWTYASPLLALVCTVLIGVVLFALLGKDPVRGLQVFFWDPIKTPYALGELLVKATPLLLIALGLAVCFARLSCRRSQSASNRTRIFLSCWVIVCVFRSLHYG